MGYLFWGLDSLLPVADFPFSGLPSDQNPGCALVCCCRYKNSVFLESRTTPGSRHRHIVVTKVNSEEDFRRREEAKRDAELVSSTSAVTRSGTKRCRTSPAPQAHNKWFSCLGFNFAAILSEDKILAGTNGKLGLFLLSLCLG